MASAINTKVGRYNGSPLAYIEANGKRSKFGVIVCVRMGDMCVGSACQYDCTLQLIDRSVVWLRDAR